MELGYWDDLKTALSEHQKQQTEDDPLESRATFLRTVANIKKLEIRGQVCRPSLMMRLMKISVRKYRRNWQMHCRYSTLNQTSEKSSDVGLWIVRVKLMQGDVTGAINAFHDVVRRDQATGSGQIGSAEIVSGLQEIELLARNKEGQQESAGYPLSHGGNWNTGWL